MAPDAGRRLGYTITKAVLVIDLAGFGQAHRSALKALASMVAENYPQSVWKVYLLNTPKLFAVAGNLMAAKEMRDKVTAAQPPEIHIISTSLRLVSTYLYCISSQLSGSFRAHGAGARVRIRGGAAVRSQVCLSITIRQVVMLGSGRKTISQTLLAGGVDVALLPSSVPGGKAQEQEGRL